MSAAETYSTIADRIRSYRPDIAEEFDGLALEALRADRIHASNIAFRNEQFAQYVPLVRNLLLAGKLDPIPAIAFLEAHGQPSSAGRATA